MLADLSDDSHDAAPARPAGPRGGPAQPNPDIPDASTVTVRAPAKINLSLAVLGRRADGYHDLESWVVQLDWCDVVRTSLADRLAISVTGAAGEVPSNDTNLAWRAAVALGRAAGREPTVRINLDKQIPAGGGLGGGSSDAAATLVALDRLWGLNWGAGKLLTLAAGLGSDVPLFLEPAPAILRGRGERIERVATSWQGWVALAVPNFGVSTAEVYRNWRPPADLAAHDQPWTVAVESAADLACHLFNDLERPAFAHEPRLARLHAAIDGLQGRPVRMTGSGSCLFALFDAAAEAEAWCDAARRVVEPTVRWKVTRVISAECP